jgi:L-amino acid N-acyltransferase YncA
MQHFSIRPATLNDLPALTAIHNHYVINTHVTFDVHPFDPEQRRPCFTRIQTIAVTDCW